MRAFAREAAAHATGILIAAAVIYLVGVLGGYISANAGVILGASLFLFGVVEIVIGFRLSRGYRTGFIGKSHRGVSEEQRETRERESPEWSNPGA